MTNAIITLDFYGALLIGLLASSHCLAMCGGVSAAFGMAAGNRQALLVSLFSLGRVACYGMLGLAVGWLSHWLGSQWLPLMQLMRVVAGLLLIAIAAYVGQWWLGLRHLENLGQHLWRRLSPLTEKLLPIRSPGQALSLGILWGFLPCGLIYSTLLWASMQSDTALGSGLLMAAFGVGTLPAMVGIGLLGQQGSRLLRQPAFRQFAAVLLLLMGGWTITAALAMNHQGHGGHHGHAGHAVVEQESAVEDDAAEGMSGEMEQHDHHMDHAAH